MFEFLEGISQHWAFIGGAVTINALVSISKKALKLFPVGDKTYSLIAHGLPVMFAILIALIPVEVGGDTFWHRVMFFVPVGLMSSWLYNALRIYAKNNGYGGVFESERPTEAPPA